MKQLWIKEGGDSFFGKLIFFIIWPFGAWLYSLIEPRSRSSYLIFFLFSLLLLWHMAPTGINDKYDDFLGILNEFQNQNLTTSEFIDLVVAYFSFSKDAPKELYQDFLIWFTKIFTDNYHFFFLFAAIPVAILQLMSLRRITSDVNFYPCLYGLIAMMMMILPRDIISVQNPRFATGLWLFVTCSFYFFSEDKKRVIYILPMFLLPLIHAAFLPALVLLAVYLVIPKKIKFLELLAIFSIPLMFVDSNIIDAFNFDILPKNIMTWAENYSSTESYAKHILHTGRSGFWWVESIFTTGLKLTYVALTLQVIKNKKHLEDNTEARNFYPFFLVSFSFINLIQFVPVLGLRYFWMLQIIVFYQWFKTFHFSKKTPYWMLLGFYSLHIVQRYGYVLGGALSVNMPPDIFFTPLPYLVGKGLFW